MCIGPESARAEQFRLSFVPLLCFHCDGELLLQAVSLTLSSAQFLTKAHESYICRFFVALHVLLGRIKLSKRGSMIIEFMNINCFPADHCRLHLYFILILILTCFFQEDL